MRDSPELENAASEMPLKHTHKRALVSTDLHLRALLIGSSIIPFPSFIRKRMSRKQKRRKVKEERGAQIALLLTSFLCNLDHVSTTFKDRELKHFFLIALKLQNTYKWLLFSEVCLKMRFLHLTLHRTTKSHAFML